MRLVFVRHAESSANAEGRLQGHADFGLSKQGRAQARRLARRFKREEFRPTHVYSSPLTRAAETARIIATQWGVPVVHRDELKEQDVGVFSGLTWEEARARFPAQVDEFKSKSWEAVDGAETAVQRDERARRFIASVLEGHRDEDVLLLVTHGGILQYLVAALLGTGRTWGLTAGNTALFDFTLDLGRWSEDGGGLLDPGLWRINRFNDDTHLA